MYLIFLNKSISLILSSRILSDLWSSISAPELNCLPRGNSAVEHLQKPKQHKYILERERQISTDFSDRHKQSKTTEHLVLLLFYITYELRVWCSDYQHGNVLQIPAKEIAFTSLGNRSFLYQLEINNKADQALQLCLASTLEEVQC